MSTGQQKQQRPPIDIAALAAALGSNVVPFTPSREEPQPANTEWTEGLDLIDQAAAFLRNTEQRAQVAEDRAEKVAFKAMEGLRTAQQRFEQAEAHAREVTLQAADEVRAAQERSAEAEGWAEAAEERAREAESRMKDAERRMDEAERRMQEADSRQQEAESRAEAAEARAKAAEDGLRSLTGALKQKLTLPVHAAPIEEARPALRRRAG